MQKKFAFVIFVMVDMSTGRVGGQQSTEKEMCNLGKCHMESLGVPSYHPWLPVWFFSTGYYITRAPASRRQHCDLRVFFVGKHNEGRISMQYWEWYA